MLIYDGIIRCLNATLTDIASVVESSELIDREPIDEEPVVT